MTAPREPWEAVSQQQNPSAPGNVDRHVEHPNRDRQRSLDPDRLGLRRGSTDQMASLVTGSSLYQQAKNRLQSHDDAKTAKIEAARQPSPTDPRPGASSLTDDADRWSEPTPTDSLDTVAKTPTT